MVFIWMNSTYTSICIWSGHTQNAGSNLHGFQNGFFIVGGTENWWVQVSQNIDGGNSGSTAWWWATIIRHNPSLVTITDLCGQWSTHINTPIVGVQSEVRWHCVVTNQGVGDVWEYCVLQYNNNKSEINFLWNSQKLYHSPYIVDSFFNNRRLFWNLAILYKIFLEQSHIWSTLYTNVKKK